MSSSWDASWSQTQEALRELRNAYDVERGSSQALLLAHRSFNAVLRDLSLARDIHSVFGELARVVETVQEGRLAAIHLLEPETGHLLLQVREPGFDAGAILGRGAGDRTGDRGEERSGDRPGEGGAQHPEDDPAGSHASPPANPVKTVTPPYCRIQRAYLPS